jgi:HPt (histidine-containing phosphotransfer) domain-containing protein
LSDGDTESLLELIELYLSKTTEQIHQLEKAIDHADSATIARIAHSLVGANAMVGMDFLLPLLRTLEQHGEKRDIGRARSSLKTLRKEFERIQEGLKKYVQTLSKA